MTRNKKTSLVRFIHHYSYCPNTCIKAHKAIKAWFYLPYVDDYGSLDGNFQGVVSRTNAAFWEKSQNFQQFFKMVKV